MSEDIQLRITVDETPLDHAMEKKAQVEAAVAQTAQLSYAKLRAIANAANGIINMVENVLTIAGVAISRTSRAVIQGVMNIASAFISIGAAESVTPYQQIAAVITIAQSVVMIALASQMEAQSSALETGMNAAVGAIRDVAGLWRWDW
jgi:hypothetical protein